jgi:hypothetical protein
MRWMHPPQRSAGGERGRQQQLCGDPVHPGWPRQQYRIPLASQHHSVRGSAGVGQHRWLTAPRGKDRGCLGGQQGRDDQCHRVERQAQPHLIAAHGDRPPPSVVVGSCVLASCIGRWDVRGGLNRGWRGTDRELADQARSAGHPVSGSDDLHSRRKELDPTQCGGGVVPAAEGQRHYVHDPNCLAGDAWTVANQHHRPGSRDCVAVAAATRCDHRWVLLCRAGGTPPDRGTVTSARWGDSDRPGHGRRSSPSNRAHTARRFSRRYCGPSATSAWHAALQAGQRRPGGQASAAAHTVRPHNAMQRPPCRGVIVSSTTRCSKPSRELVTGTSSVRRESPTPVIAGIPSSFSSSKRMSMRVRPLPTISPCLRSREGSAPWLYPPPLVGLGSAARLGHRRRRAMECRHAESAWSFITSGRLADSRSPGSRPAATVLHSQCDTQRCHVRVLGVKGCCT